MLETDKMILVADDELMIREAVSSYLMKQGCNVITAEDGRQALEIFRRRNIVLVVLDLMLPGISGERVCEEIRRSSRVPVIMLTAKTQEEDILNGLNIGADDYVTKPFSIKELYARINAVLRRTENTPLAQKFSWNDDDLVIDIEHGETFKNGAKISMTPSEWKIISALIQHPQKVFSRDELISLVFSYDFDSYYRVIDTHIKNLRKKIEDDPKAPVYIKTVHGMGYKFGGNKD